MEMPGGEWGGIVREIRRRVPDIERAAFGPKQPSKLAHPAGATAMRGKKPCSRASPHLGENIKRSLPAKQRAIFVIKTSRFCPCHAAKMTLNPAKYCAETLTRNINETQ